MAGGVTDPLGDLDGLRAQVAELVAANDHLRLLVGATPVGLVAVDAGGVFTDAIGGALGELGLTAASLLGRSVFDVFADQPELLDHARRVLRGERVVGEVTLGEHDVLVSYQPIVEGGAITGAVAIGTIVTAERRSARHAEALVELSRRTIEAGSNLGGVLDAVTAIACDALGRAAMVVLTSIDSTHIDIVSGRDRQGTGQYVLLGIVGQPVGSAVGAQWARTITDGQPQFMSAPSAEALAERIADPALAELVRSQRLNGCLALPMTAAGRMVGALTICRAEGDRAFDPGDVEFGMTLAERAAIAIDHARLFAAVQQRAAQQAGVAELGTLALRQSDLHDLVQPAVDLLADGLAADGAVIALEDGHPEGPAVVATVGIPAEILGQRRWPRAGGSLVARMIESGDPVVVTDVASDPRVLASDTILLQHRSALGVRIEGRERPCGFLAVVSRDRRAFTHDDVNFVTATANVLSIAADAARAADELRHNALHDMLTGLPNRTLLADRLRRALDLAQRRAGLVAVLVCDLDRFKVINDSLGHPAGDEVLVAAAERLVGSVRTTDTVARFGGDEMVVVAEVADVAEVLHLAARIVDAFRHPFHFDDGECFATMSVGIALGVGDDATSDSLLRDADMALYRAKELGRSRYELFDEALRARADERLRIETALRHGIARGELHVVYQPIMAIASGVVLGVEALVRWEHPELGRLLPASFLPVAEDAGLLGEISGWVLAEAAEHVARWSATPAWGQRWVALNLAPQQVADPDVAEWFAATVDAAGADPAQLCVEVTEEAFLEDTARVTANLTALRTLGVRVGIDDFGAGYSSLGYLRRLPIDLIKIDGCFVSGITAAGSDRAIVDAMVRLAHTLGLTVVAEGVEEELQLAELARMGCDGAQGEHVARPIEPERVLEVVLEHTAGR